MPMSPYGAINPAINSGSTRNEEDGKDRNVQGFGYRALRNVASAAESVRSCRKYLYLRNGSLKLDRRGALHDAQPFEGRADVSSRLKANSHTRLAISNMQCFKASRISYDSSFEYQS
ncbi:hypothetical protein N7468_004065 [Penicillium chermesinum]|uniref:Uncharacterized protein n=1 Tax=Penicillium chermesinum TaxID=63820 RepID=A0A9W9P7J8_9EURO|nr:uncharacterized protein N7468_004065 [Penicillium chermesinum]KAJ5239446.1 hypothetical protein N7468_004065 [Penicillium chermesinum]